MNMQINETHFHHRLMIFRAFKRFLKSWNQAINTDPQPQKPVLMMSFTASRHIMVFFIPIFLLPFHGHHYQSSLTDLLLRSLVFNYRQTC